MLWILYAIALALTGASAVILAYQLRAILRDKRTSADWLLAAVVLFACAFVIVKMVVPWVGPA